MTKKQNFIKITDSVFKKIKDITAPDKEDAGKKLRIAVKNGGCSGFLYEYTFEDQERKSDIILTKDRECIIIDPISKQLLEGSVIDYVETLGFSGFEISNPNAKNKCSCGSSFSI